jgi:asparagine synthase (glutamine-hydrolysing)
MCRIAGIISNRTDNLEEIVIKMCESMEHGGPDDFGIYKNLDKKIVIGHRRLSIIDLSNAGHQPMLSQDSNIVLSFNGEIFNYLELRDELIGIGYKFKTNTDTEVIIYSYMEWGVNSFYKLQGMYAFAIYDKITNKLFLVRDHAGIKPLYYSNFNDNFIFSSEVRGISSMKKDIKTNEDWPIFFLAFGFIPEPFTTLENVYQLSKGSYLEYQIDTKTFFIKKNQTEKLFKKIIKDESIAKQHIISNLKNSVKSHLISDAPIGLFLSGGIDSSILTILASQLKSQSLLKTLSIDFEEDTFSESVYQDMISEKTKIKHFRFTISKLDLTSNLQDIFRAMDQPSIDAINSYFICKKAKQIGLKVVISGVGADEFFGGYPSFKRIKKLLCLKFLPNFLFPLFEFSPKNNLKRISYLYRKDIIGEYLFLRGINSINEISKLTKKSRKEVKYILEKITIDSKPKDTFERVQIMEAEIYMQNQLLKDLDFMSMWHGVEARVPFLDQNLLESITSIDSKLKIKNGIYKYLLKESYKDILPGEIINRKKMGFTFPFILWFKGLILKFSQNQELLKNRQYFIKNKISWIKFWAGEIYINKYLDGN